ncbi:MAG: acyl carrier protein [Puniceicoccales bacterium]|jgi:acyl carrier protein|nr:acyl carrier protein [Puniceicoccales bacterium]
MDKQEIFTQLKGYLQQLFDVDPETVTLQTNVYTDLHLDSIDAVDLVVLLQRVTGKKIRPEDFKKVRTVEDIVDSIHSLLQTP